MDFYDKYTKKEAYNLYMSALCYEINDSRFDRIKGALYEAVHLGQYSKDSFIDLLDSLFNLSDSALADIESGNFKEFYTAYLSNSSGMPEDFYYMSLFMDIIYTDYKNIESTETYHCLSNDIGFLLRDIPVMNDERIINSLMKSNPELIKLFMAHHDVIDYKILYKKNYSINQLMAYSDIEYHFIVSFLMLADEFNHDYTLPSKLLNKMVYELEPNVILVIGDYLKYNDNTHEIIKMLFDRLYLQDKEIFDIDEDGNIKLIREKRK